MIAKADDSTLKFKVVKNSPVSLHAIPYFRLLLLAFRTFTFRSRVHSASPEKVVINSNSISSLKLIITVVL